MHEADEVQAVPDSVQTKIALKARCPCECMLGLELHACQCRVMQVWYARVRMTNSTVDAGDSHFLLGRVQAGGFSQ